MKKRLVTALALMFGLGVGATAFAAANPFVDVPAKHWAYDAVNKLAKAGIVDGYGDGTYRGDRNITRYEMAQIVAKAMARSDKADAETKATIDKLATEFSTEIENLGVRVTALEKKSDNLKFDGNLRVRYINDNLDTLQSTKAEEARYRLGATGTVNDDWSVRAMLQGTNAIQTTAVDDSEVQLVEMYAKGNVGDATLTLGKWMQTSTADLMFDEDAIKGAKIGFGNQLKANVYYGVIAPAETDNTDANNNHRVLGGELNWAPDKNLEVFGSFNQIETRDNTAMKLNGGKSTLTATEDSVNAWEAGFKYKFAQDWKLTGVYTKTDADTEDTGYKAEVQYKAADLNKVNSWQLAAGYAKTELNSVYDSGMWVAKINAGTVGTPVYDGAKGWYVDGAFVPAKNVKFRTIYGQFDGVNTSAEDSYYRAQVEFFF